MPLQFTEGMDISLIAEHRWSYVMSYSIQLMSHIVIRPIGKKFLLQNTDQACSLASQQCIENLQSLLSSRQS